MELIRGLNNLICHRRPCVATIGNFDGVHLGHQRVIGQLLNLAKQYQLPATIMTFDPLPQEYFLGDQAPMRLMPFREKWVELERLGVDRLFCPSSNHKLAECSAERFVHEILHQGLGIQHLLIGDDFQFGQDRQGDYALLVQEGQKLGFAVDRAETFAQQGERVSSTRIRALLCAGEIAAANQLLGRPFTLSGPVSAGLQLGRQLGVPTANIRVKTPLSAMSGVYVVAVEIEGERFQGVANLGFRPTVSAQKAGGSSEEALELRLETHLFEFNRDLYRRRIRVQLLHKVREEKKFASLELLQAAIESDIQQAKAWFK